MALYFLSLSFIVIALVLRIPYFKLLDLCGVGECVTMAMLRFNCSIQGCCGGRVIYTAADGAVVRFPSQMVELIVGLSLAVLFVYCAYRKPRLHGIMYPWFMFLYGMIRTGLNFFREEWASWPETQVFPRGMIWSVASLFIGLVWLWIAYRYRKKAIQEMSE